MTMTAGLTGPAVDNRTDHYSVSGFYMCYVCSDLYHTRNSFMEWYNRKLHISVSSGKYLMSDSYEEF